MTYTPTEWTTGDTITAAKLNNIEEGIAEAAQSGGGWDAIIRLTHANNSGPDTTANLTPSIMSGTYASLVAKMQGDGCPTILVEYVHPLWGIMFANPMISGITANQDSLRITIAGYFPVSESQVLGLSWDSTDTLSWPT